jgi:hypothetical protein
MNGIKTTLDLEAGRRAFLRTAGLGGLALTMGGSVLGSTAAQAAGPSDVAILNFALNLEYLEAEFYLRATTGTGLSDGDIDGTGGEPGKVVGGGEVKFKNKAIRNLAEEIAGDEKAHVLFLRAALGSAAVSRPRIDLRNSFSAAAQAAGLVGPGEPFDPFASDTGFLLGAYIFEDVGVTAYKGAARFIQNKDYLEAAAGILAVEAYHAGAIRTIMYERGLFKEARAISDARDSLDGDEDIDQGIGGKDKANIVPTDENGFAYSRTIPQVASIVYLGGTKKGGFFPMGINPGEA